MFLPQGADCSSSTLRCAQILPEKLRCRSSTSHFPTPVKSIKQFAQKSFSVTPCEQSTVNIQAPFQPCFFRPLLRPMFIVNLQNLGGKCLNVDQDFPAHIRQPNNLYQLLSGANLNSLDFFEVRWKLASGHIPTPTAKKITRAESTRRCSPALVR